MARGRRGGRGRGGGDDGALSAFAESLKDVNPLLGELGKGLAFSVEKSLEFGKNMVAHSSEVVRAKAAFEELSAKSTLSSLEGLGGGFGSAVGGVRRGLAGVTAAGGAAQDLEDLATQSAFRGIPLDKGLEEQLFPILQARRKSVELARQQASDVSGPAVRKEALDAGGDIGERAGRALHGTPAEGLFGLGEKLGDLIYDAIEKRLRERGSR